MSDNTFDARSRNSGGPAKISREQCIAFCRLFKYDVRKKTIAAAADVSPTAVTNHVHGDCRHEHDYHHDR